MPRAARIGAPGVLQHVIGRGIEKRAIFRDDTDRDDVITRLAHLATKGALDVYAWALMPNHFHLLCKSKLQSLSRRRWHVSLTVQTRSGCHQPCSGSVC
jgi:REP element-mobilizing transposase RayT